MRFTVQYPIAHAGYDSAYLEPAVVSRFAAPTQMYVLRFKFCRADYKAIAWILKIDLAWLGGSCNNTCGIGLTRCYH